MRIQPRQQVLEIWRATARYSIDRSSNMWIPRGRGETNSITDAEQLLCLMVPATEIDRFRLDQPNETDREVLEVLAPMGDALEVPQLVVRTLIDYLRRYSDSKDRPVFSGGSRFSTVDPDGHPTSEQLELEVVESYAASLTLMLSALGFVKVFRKVITRADLLAEMDELERLAALRLSAAMVGLLRSFTINVFNVDSSYGKALQRMVNQTGQPDRKVVSELQYALRETAARLRDLDVGIREVSDLDSPTKLFECGWSWGVTSDAPAVDFAETAEEAQPPGLAPKLPYLYFSVVALDAIVELHSERTRILGLLNDNQLRLSEALRIRWDLTQRYWATIATFGEGRWPVEDIPWRTTDDVQSDFLTLLVTSIAARRLSESNAALGRLGNVLGELANRGRLIRRAIDDDPAVLLHHPGFVFELDETEQLGPKLSWVASDHGPLLLKRVIRVAELIDEVDGRRRMLALADNIWEHIGQRRIADGEGRGLWDQPGNMFPAVADRFVEPSWHHTLRVVESLMIAAAIIERRPLFSPDLAAEAYHLLAEAEHLYDQELFAGSAASGRPMRERIEAVGKQLQRAQEVVNERPGSAIAVLHNVLRDIDGLTAARQDVWGVF